MILKSLITLKKDNENKHLNITIKERLFSTELYDQRDGFNFPIVRLQYKCSNILSKMFYSTISQEISRIGKATSFYNDFLSSIHTLISPKKKQGPEINHIIKGIK